MEDSETQKREFVKRHRYATEWYIETKDEWYWNRTINKIEETSELLRKQIQESRKETVKLAVTSLTVGVSSAVLAFISLVVALRGKCR